MVYELVKSILSSEHPIEVCIHIDGSNDGTAEALSEINDPRLRVTQDVNMGSGPARCRAVRSATGTFIIILDDDDTFYPEILASLLDHLRGVRLDLTLCGVVVHYHNQDGELLGTPFVRKRTNYFQMRLADGVRGDKREIIKSAILKPLAERYLPAERHVPLSLLWYTCALDYDMICADIAIGKALYQPGGLSSQARRITRDNPLSMIRQRATIIHGFVRGRHRSARALASAFAGVAYFALHWVRTRLIAR